MVMGLGIDIRLETIEGKAGHGLLRTNIMAARVIVFADTGMRGTVPPVGRMGDNLSRTRWRDNPNSHAQHRQTGFRD